MMALNTDIIVDTNILYEVIVDQILDYQAQYSGVRARKAYSKKEAEIIADRIFNKLVNMNSANNDD